MKKLYLENRTSLSRNAEIRMKKNVSDDGTMTADTVPPNVYSNIED